MHHSRLSGFIIDCETDDLAAASAFWRETFGDSRARKPQGKYVKLDPQAGLNVGVQMVRHPSRVHLDVAADDIPAEIARLERLGARVVKALKNWTVMEAPTGHRFCVVRAEGGFRGDGQRLGEVNHDGSHDEAAQRGPEERSWPAGRARLPGGDAV